MTRLRFFVYALVPLYIDVHLARPTLKANDVKSIELTHNGEAIDVSGWQRYKLKPASGDFPTRVALVAPADFKRECAPGDEVSLYVYLKDDEFGSTGTVIDPQPDGEGIPQGPGSQGPGEGPGYPGDRSSLAEAVSMYAAYPILTAPAERADVGGGGAGAAGDARGAVAREWRAVLGRVPRDADLASVLSALDRRFVFSEEEGAEEWTFLPNSPISQDHLGAGLSGAQASLVAFAQGVSAEIEQPVAEARALRQLADNPEELEVARRNFQASWRSFVTTLGTEGGLPTPRAAVLLRQAREQLVRFGVELGMLDPGGLETFAIADTDASDGDTSFDAVSQIPISRSFVLTRDDEERLTEFMIVRDRVAAVARAFREYVGPDQLTPDYGTVFTWLERDLDVLPELVADVRGALDSLDFSLEQQEVMPIVPDDPTSMTLAGVLQWADELAEEGRGLIQDSGVRGTGLLAERAAELGRALLSLRRTIRGGAGTGVTGARLAMSRVSVPIELLHDAVFRVRDKAAQVTTEAETGVYVTPRGGDDEDLGPDE
jgi:hypothetical protein